MGKVERINYMYRSIFMGLPLDPADITSDDNLFVGVIKGKQLVYLSHERDVIKQVARWYRLALLVGLFAILF